MGEAGLVDGRELPAEGGGPLSGPWTAGMWLCLRGDVQSKSNFRRGGRSGSWARNTAFETAVKAAAREHRPAEWLQSDPAAPVAARPQILLCAWAQSLIDVGNLDKSLLDALEGTLMASDAQVRWSLSGGDRVARQPGILVGLAQLPAGSSVSAQLAACRALLDWAEAATRKVTR